MAHPRDNDLLRLADTLGVQFAPNKANAAFATAAVTAAQSGEMFNCAVDAVVTLPAMSAALRGVVYKFKCGTASAGTGVSISPNAADAISGFGLTAVLDKDLINTGATDTINDWVVIRGTGQAGAGAWVITDINGIWAKEA